jgi:hypothetical protein
VPAPPIVNVDWLNQNSMRAYPLSETASRRDVTDSYTLPDNFIVDMVLPVNASLNYDPASFYVSKVNVFGNGVTLDISYWTGTEASLVATITIDANTFTRNETFYLQGSEDFEGVLGKIVIGSIDTLLQRPGSYDFDLAGGRIESCIVVPDLRGVTGFRVVDDENDEGTLYQGDIAFEPGSNFRIAVSDFSGVTVLTFSAIDGEGTIADCICEGEMADLEPIRTLNGVLPDSLGNINLLGDDCLEVTPQAGANAVSLTDKCSKPCCGCPELNTLVDDQKRMRDQVQTMENLMRKMESNLDVMQTLLSMIGPCG